MPHSLLHSESYGKKGKSVRGGNDFRGYAPLSSPERSPCGCGTEIPKHSLDVGSHGGKGRSSNSSVGVD
ncbi:unnamed protein product [Boreogadus saida]